MGAAGGKCCADDVTAAQQDIMQAVPAQAPMAEELVKSSPVVKTSPVVAQSPAESKKREVEGVSAGVGGYGKEFTVQVTKTQDRSRLGIDVDLTDGIALYIEKINDGIISDWNKANPSKEIRPGDRVLSVNGSKGPASEMTELCKTQTTLELKVVRD
ncbi:unnamed protein product [Polarella glacialis]|uniref:PDZ domain-containing protein n=1 Tax=Polarella glacialis TaxID=89957 RepID=A0A813KVD6_POLGL|nr:unnamed protein product [Polarella glacialis]CAE8709248.1 unnamed protein product [Polarella glacialis]